MVSPGAVYFSFHFTREAGTVSNIRENRRTRNSILKGAAGATQNSMLPDSVRHLDNIMANVNGRTGRHYYAPAGRGFWRPPEAVKDAISRGNKKCRGVDS